MVHFYQHVQCKMFSEYAYIIFSIVVRKNPVVSFCYFGRRRRLTVLHRLNFVTAACQMDSQLTNG